MGVLIEQGGGGHDHSGDAVAALICSFIHERLLEGVEPAVGSKAFDGGDGFAVGIGGDGLAGESAFAVDVDGAGAAIARPAAEARAEKMQVFAEDIEERALGIGGDGLPLAVDSEGDG